MPDISPIAAIPANNCLIILSSLGIGECTLNDWRISLVPH
jgi:hypothetical protein